MSIDRSGRSMGQLAGRLADLVTQATSPDTQISVRIRGKGDDIELLLRPGAYARYTETGLADQLARLATLAFTRYRRDEQEMLDAMDPSWGDDDGDRYLDRLGQLVARGSSDDRRIQLQARSLLSWQVDITPGTLDELPEGRFLTGLTAAARRLLADHNAQVFALRDDVDDLGYPEQLRKAIGLPPRRNAGSRW